MLVFYYNGGKQEGSSVKLFAVCEVVSSSKEIDSQKLPPTERAAHYHSLIEGSHPLEEAY